MTRAPHAPRSSFSDLAEAVAVMRERGLRLSTPRRLLLERLFAAAAPLSAEDLSGSLALDLAVTYRNLETLEANGLVHHVHLGHGPGLYALVGAGDHEYLYCERCGAVRTVVPEELDGVRASLRKRFGYVAHFTHHAIVGNCEGCEARDSEGAEPRRSRHQHAG